MISISVKDLVHRFEVHKQWGDIAGDHESPLDVTSGFDGSDTANPPMPSLEPMNFRHIVMQVVAVEWFGTFGSLRKYRLELSDNDGSTIYAHISCLKENRRKMYKLIASGQVKPGLKLFVKKFLMQTGIPFGLNGAPRVMMVLKQISSTCNGR